MINPITSIKARCRDCHRCIRACPVKAISLQSGQASVVPELCINCGACVASCPQEAKAVVSQAEDVKSMLLRGEQVIVSLAPSYAAAFADCQPGQVVAGLKALGFTRVEETALAAEAVAEHYRRLIEAGAGTVISSCCPAIVNLLEVHFPELLPLLADSASPMIAHALDLRRRYPDARVVFIGPCIAKIQEASRGAAGGAVDAVLTFPQLAGLWQERGIAPNLSVPVEPDQATRTAAIYPISRGILATAGISADAAPECLAISGVDSCLQVFAELAAGKISPRFIEALACPEGCIGGPGMCSSESIPVRRARLLEHHRHRCSDAAREELPPMALPSAQFRVRAPRRAQPSESEIRAILAKIGKNTPDDESNCGGCGYPTCRDKAIATYQGLAELEMCVPYMRAKFESLSHVVVDSALDAIIIVTSDLLIHQINPTANRLFNPFARPVKGQHLAILFDPSDFQYVIETGEVLRKAVKYPELDLCTSQVIYPLPAYDLVVGVITDTSEEERKRRALEKKHAATAERATQVIKNQMKLAQEIAGLLGEATAESKAILWELIGSLAEEVDEA